jgi:hypothetical protein
MEYQDFSSMPPDQERQFVAFERRTVESGKKAWQIGMIAGGAFGVVLLIIVYSFPAPKAKHADALDTDLPAETAAPEPSEAPAPAPTPTEPPPAEAPEGAAAPAEGGAAAPAEGGATAPAAGAQTPPPPPPGATKAPPTALVKDAK